MDQRLETDFFVRARSDIGAAAWEQAGRRDEMLSYDEALVYAQQAASIRSAEESQDLPTSPPLHRS
jgi:hypothetical protein